MNVVTMPYCRRRHDHRMHRRSFHVMLLLVIVAFDVLHPVRSSESPASPIPNFEPSWIASAAHGLSVAISCRPSHDEECVLLLLESSRKSLIDDKFLDEVQPQNQTNSDGMLDYYGLQLLSNENVVALRCSTLPSSSMPLSLSSRWIKLGGHAIGTMTGLYSDVDHVQKRLQRALDGHVALYAEEGMPVTSLVRILSVMLQSATRYQGGRPRAIQSMIIGAANLNSHGPATSSSSSSSSPSQQDLLAIYTMDPTGGWQNYASGASAIGRLAPQARSCLLELLKDDQRRVDPLRMMRLAMLAVLATLENVVDSIVPSSALLPEEEEEQQQQQQQQAISSFSTSAHSFEAVLIWKKATSRKCRVALVNPAQVEECHRRAWSKLFGESQQQHR